MYTNSPFAEFDPAKFAKVFQPVAFDHEAMQVTHQRNVEAVAVAGRKAGEAFQAIAKMQAEILRRGFEDVTEATREVLQAATPEESAQAQVEITRKAVETQVAHAREIADLTAKSGAELLELMNARFLQGVAEFQAVAKTDTAEGAAKPKRKTAA